MSAAVQNLPEGVLALPLPHLTSSDEVYCSPRQYSQAALPANAAHYQHRYVLHKLLVQQLMLVMQLMLPSCNWSPEIARCHPDMSRVQNPVELQLPKQKDSPVVTAR